MSLIAERIESNRKEIAPPFTESELDEWEFDFTHDLLHYESGVLHNYGNPVLYRVETECEPIPF
jgi:hypothetical protein